MCVIVCNHKHDFICLIRFLFLGDGNKPSPKSKDFNLMMYNHLFLSFNMLAVLINLCRLLIKF